MADKKDPINLFMEEVVDIFSDNVITTDNEEVTPISTGSISLDASIGIGGIPKGRITELFGSEGTGKTTLALSIANQALLKGERVLYVDAENMLDFGLVNQIVGDVGYSDNLVILNPETGEDAFRMVEMGILSNLFSLVILDSIGALAPKKEKKDDLEDSNVALTARLVTKALRRVSFAVKSNNVALLLLNQVRDKVGSFMGGYETPGGHALKHFTALRIALTKGKQIMEGSGDSKESVGIDVNFSIRKNKLSAPFRGFHFPIIFGKGVDTYMDYLEFCVLLGIIKKAGSFFKFEGETIGQGRLNAANHIREDNELLDKLKEMVYNIMEINTNEEEILDE